MRGRFVPSLKSLAGLNAVGLEHDHHFFQRRFVDLRDAAFVDGQNAADFLHRHFVGVVEHDYFLVPFWQSFHGVAKDSAAADLFAAHSWYVAPPPPPPAPVVYQPPPAPTAPPLPFAFMGSFRTDSGGAIYYLTAGDRVYDVKVGDTLDNTYSVDGVKSGQLLLTYMPLKIQQSIAVGDE